MFAGIAFISSAIFLVGSFGAKCLDYAVNGGIDFTGNHFALTPSGPTCSVSLFASSAYLFGEASGSTRQDRTRRS
jgi:hypothetical protein